MVTCNLSFSRVCLPWTEGVLPVHLKSSGPQSSHLKQQGVFECSTYLVWPETFISSLHSLPVPLATIYRQYSCLWLGNGSWPLLLGWPLSVSQELTTHLHSLQATPKQWCCLGAAATGWGGGVGAALRQSQHLGPDMRVPRAVPAMSGRHQDLSADGGVEGGGCGYRLRA